MSYEVMPLDHQGMIYAVIQTPPGSTLEYTNARCHELQKIAKTIDGVTSVLSLAGYEVLTEGRDSNAATCLIHLQNRSERKLTSRQIIEKFEEKRGQIPNVKLELFEPPAVAVFGAAGGFSVRIVDKTNNNAERLGELTEKFMDDLSKREELRGLFTFCASNYPQYELVINNEVALQKGVSIMNAIDYLAIAIGRDLQAGPKFRRFPEDFANLFFQNARGEMVPYASFMQLKKKQGFNEINR
jgi:HAE1 family hydrophobic/amphiphilic exporter-1